MASHVSPHIEGMRIFEPTAYPQSPIHAALFSATRTVDTVSHSNLKGGST